MRNLSPILILPISLIYIDRTTSRFSRRDISQPSLHASILGAGDIDTTTDYFSFQATHGVLSLNIDDGIDSGGSFDSWLELYDSSFNLIASNDDARRDTGSQFSFRGSNFTNFSFDSFLQYQVETDGLFYAATQTLLVQIILYISLMVVLQEQ